jgi:hypothetical protein
MTLPSRSLLTGTSPLEFVPTPESYQTICCQVVEAVVPTLLIARQRRVTFEGMLASPDTADCPLPSQQIIRRLRDGGGSVLILMDWGASGSLLQGDCDFIYVGVFEQDCMAQLSAILLATGIA